MGYEIRCMTRDELDLAVEWAAKEGWNPGLHDADAFYQADPNGFLIGLLDGKPIGCISAVSYKGVFGFIGFYIVIPEYRGQGFGIELWNAAMARLDGHNIGLDGVIAQQDNYRKSGFRLAYSNIRYEATVAAAKLASPPPEVVPMDACDSSELDAYDQTCFPVARSEFLQAWLGLPDSTGCGWVEDGQLCGFGIVRKCRQGYKVGPLFADDKEKAESLYLALCYDLPAGEKVYLDVPEVNEPAMALAKKYSMTEVFGTARMYTGEDPDIQLERVFGVTTFELG